jgi:hypothetical protein
VSAQGLPERPVTFLDGRLSVSGDASVSFSTSDNETYFNYGDYRYDMMRLIRVGAAASFRVASRVTAVADLRGEGEPNGGRARAYPVWLYLRVQPFESRSLTVSAGLVQPAFGAFPRRRYGADNLLIGYPLAYQYTTAVRADALPATSGELLLNRGRGWAPRYSIGGGAGVSGLPLVDTTGWSPGIEVTAGSNQARATVAVTRGGLANPGSSSVHGGWEVTGRFETRPLVGLVLGASGAYGSYLDEQLSPIAATAALNRDAREAAIGADAEYSWGYWLLRLETIVSRRTLPAFHEPYLSDPLTATAVDLEARYTILPGLYAAARVGAITFGTIQGPSGLQTWDANVVRVEAGGGFFFTRNLLAKVVYQHDHRDADHAPTLDLAAVQLVARF